MPKGVELILIMNCILYVFYCMLLSALVGICVFVCVYVYIECKTMHGMSNIKNYLLCGANIQPLFLIPLFQSQLRSIDVLHIKSS